MTAEAVIANLLKNADSARKVLRAALQRLPAPRDCECATALAHALVTRFEDVPVAVRTELAPLVGKYMK